MLKWLGDNKDALGVIFAFIGGAWVLFKYFINRKEATGLHRKNSKNLEGNDAIESADLSLSSINQSTDDSEEFQEIKELELFRSINSPDTINTWFNYMCGYGSYKVAYIELYNFSKICAHKIKIKIISEKRQSPLKKCIHIFNGEERQEAPKAALVGYQFHKSTISVSFKFQQTCYDDYWKKFNTLKAYLNYSDHFTQRDDLIHKMLSDRIESDSNSPLPVICGAGLFIQEDDQLLISKHSNNQRTYPNVWSFSTSCAMNYGGYPHPVQELSRRAFEEIAHQVNPDQVDFLSFGLDPRYGYFHFTCIEKCTGFTRDLDYLENFSRDKYKPENIELINISREVLIAEVWNRAWEPAAELALLQIAQKEYIETNIDDVLADYYETWKVRMIAEWTRRATDLSGMPYGKSSFVGLSSRYSESSMNHEERTENYANSIFNFIEPDLSNKICVVEFGCGPGRITKKLAEAKIKFEYEFYALDICSAMIYLNKKRLGELSNQVEYIFDINDLNIQTLQSTKKKNVAVLDRVLIHNVSNISFYKVLSDLDKITDTIFIFEDVTELNREYSNFTRIRQEWELTESLGID